MKCVKLTNENTRHILAIMTVFGIFSFFFCMFFSTGKISGESVIIFILGALAGYGGSVYGWYFGSSMSKDKPTTNTTGTSQTTTTSTQNETTGTQ